jgi:DNA-binding IclR family transcriptional regulator
VGLGKILMAYLPEEEWGRIISKEGLRRYTPNTITQVRRLKEHLKEIREKGYAFSDVGGLPGCPSDRCPNLQWRGELLAGLTIAGPVYRINKKGSRSGPVSG